MKQSGHSVVLHVTGFLHYLYIEAPRGFLRSNCESYGSFLETRLGQNAPAIHSVEILNKENLFGYQGNTQAGYIKITVTDPKYIVYDLSLKVLLIQQIISSYGNLARRKALKPLTAFNMF